MSLLSNKPAWVHKCLYIADNVVNSFLAKIWNWHLLEIVLVTGRRLEECEGCKEAIFKYKKCPVFYEKKHKRFKQKRETCIERNVSAYECYTHV